MNRGRILKAAVAVVGVVGLAFALMVPVHTQGGGMPPGLQIGLHKGREVVAGEVLVKFQEHARFTRLEQDFDADRDEEIGDGTVRRIHSRSHNVETLLAKLAERADVEYAEPNYIVRALLVPNDTYFSLQWALRNTGQNIGGVGIAGADIDATSAWDLHTGNRNNVVAVIDTGIDYTHPDLVTNVWSAPAGGVTVTIGGQSITCAGGTHGFNAITKTCDPRDNNGHGTHVSGTIGAMGSNGVGVTGVNWIASIMGLKFLDAQGNGSTADAVNAIEFAIQVKQKLGYPAGNVRVLSNSWGGGGSSQSLLTAINNAYANNMLFVAAAGNDGANNDATAFYPANYDAPNVVAVAATDNRDGLASFSNYGATTVDLGAPGVNIASTYINNQYYYMSGTSMATPHVSGVAALALAYCQPALTTDGLKTVLLANVEPIGSLAGKTVTGGRLNAYRTLTNCGSVPPPSPDFSISASPASVSVKRGGVASYSVTMTPLNGFANPVALSLTGSPTAWSFSPSSVSASSPQSTLTVSTSTSTRQGTYTLTIAGTSGSLTHNAVVTLKVTKR